VENLFESLDPASFIAGTSFSLPSSDTPRHGAIRTYADETGLTLSALSDRRFLTWIVASLMPLNGRRILEIGTGTGYLAYVLAQLAGDHGCVEGCEVIHELFAASVRNPMIRSTSAINLHDGDFVDIVPELGQFDIVIATSAMSNLHPVLLGACRPDGGMIALPIEIQGGGDCYTIFRREGAALSAVDAMLSVSVPTTGSYSSEPPWAVPVQRLIPDFDLSTAVRVARQIEWGHPVYGTLALRSFLQAHEPLFAAVSLGGDDQPFVRRMAFGLVDSEARSLCLQNSDQLLLSGGRALTLADYLDSRIHQWKAGGGKSLAGFRYTLPADAGNGVSFSPAIFSRASGCRPS
jgi:protein-L-isoaspartate O-methyltransferase